MSSFKVITGLQIHPEFGCCSQRPCHSESVVGCDAALSLNNGVDAIRERSNGECQGIRIGLHRIQEFSQENLTRMNWREVLLVHESKLLMAINNFHLLRIFSAPSDIAAVLVIDPDVELTLVEQLFCLFIFEQPDYCEIASRMS